MSSIEVNWEKIMVFSPPSERPSISCRISRILRVFAESGGRSELASTVLRRDFVTRATQASQVSLLPLAEPSLAKIHLQRE